MLHLNLKWRSTATAAAAVAVLSACASDRAGGPLSPGMNAISAQVLGSSSTYIVPGTPAGTFDLFKSDQAGRADGKEFWDNRSDDGAWDAGTGKGCAIGFYATAMMKSDCGSETDGSYENSQTNINGNAYKYYWNEADVMPASFEFSAATTYDVMFKGAYSGNMSVVGYYIKKGRKYTFTPVPNWSNKVISNVSVPITAPAGSTWGFFIANNLPGTEGIESSRCGTLVDAGRELNVACSDATGGFVTNPFQQFALFGNATGTSYLVGAEDKTVRYSTGPTPLDNDSDYNDYIWAVVPRPIVRICDFMTFGRTQIVAVNGDDVVISGNAGGLKADGSILGTFNISVGGTSYLVQDIESYDSITSGVFFGPSTARVITGISLSGKEVEIRIYDGGEPGRGADQVYLKVGAVKGVGGVEVLGPLGVKLDRGSIQYHSNCRGPG